MHRNYLCSIIKQVERYCYLILAHLLCKTNITTTQAYIVCGTCEWFE